MNAKKILAVFSASLLIFAPTTKLFADTATQTNTTSPTASSTPTQSTTDDQKQQLQQQLQDIENQIAQFQQQLDQVKSQKNTLAAKIKQLQIQQKSLALQIQVANIEIQNSENTITDLSDQIQANNQKQTALKTQVENLILQLNEADNTSLPEMLLGSDGFAGFFDDLNSYKTLNQNLSTLIEQLKQNTADLQSKQQQLSDQEDQQKSLIQLADLQNASLSQTVSEQNDLLQQTKGKESDYQIVLNDSQKQAAAIRNRIYQLSGGGPQSEVTFGQAVAIAQNVSAATGVRAAFLLAILTQESNLGKNVGTCNRPGDPASKSWKVIMKPDRDQQPFIDITSALGLDPDTTPVSCPMHNSRGKQIGWGGAMGPAQFIPSTWVGYADQIAAITGKTANPWDIHDAFIAAALKLKADGAGSQNGEWAAAMRYFSGSTNLAYRFYGDNVVKLATGYQDDIDQLNQ